MKTTATTITQFFSSAYVRRKFRLDTRYYLKMLYIRLDNWFNFKRKISWYLFLREASYHTNTLQGLVEVTLFEQLGWRRYFISSTVLNKMIKELTKAASRHYNRPDIARNMRLLYARTDGTEQDVTDFVRAFNSQQQE